MQTDAVAELLAKGRIRTASQYTYRRVFDFEDAGIERFKFTATGLIFMCAGTVVYILGRKGLIMKGQPLSAKYFPLGIVGFALLWTLTASASIVSERSWLEKARAEGTEAVVAGRIKDFVPMPVEGHADERFEVAGIPFHYSDYFVTQGFHNARSHGGPVEEGLQVRISYVSGRRGNLITRLEIASDDKK
jgi:hypothetical protein